MLALLTSAVTEAPTITILYGFPRKRNDELFPCVHFAIYGYFPGCHLYNSLTPRTPMSLLQLVRYRLSNHVSCVPQQLSSRKNNELRGYHVECLLCLLVLSSSVHSTIIITHMLINQAGSH